MASTILLIAAYGGLLLLAAEAFRRSSLANLATWGLAPFLLAPWWLVVSLDRGWFYWAKTAALVASSAAISLVRFVGPSSTILKHVRKAFLIVNILEAVVLDALATGRADGLLHATNAIAGMVLIFAIPDASSMTVEGEHRDLHFDVGWPWILGYTAWNWSLVRLNYPDIAASHAAILAAPIVFAAVNGRATWGQARAYTVAAYAMGTMTLPGAFAALDLPFEATLPTYLAVGAGLGCSLRSLLAAKRARA